jgi:hypothetical protein
MQTNDKLPEVGDPSEEIALFLTSLYSDLWVVESLVTFHTEL